MVMASTPDTVRRAWPLAAGAPGDLIRQGDWRTTSLGPLAGWDQRLRAQIDVMLQLPLPAMLLHGPQLTTLYNGHCATLLGPDHAALCGMPLAQAWPALAEAGAPALEAALNDQVGACVACAPLPLPGGGAGAAVVEVELCVTPLLDGAGGAVAALLLLHQPTRQLELERTLRRDAAHLAALFGGAKVGMSELSLAGAFVRVNPEFERMLGRSEATLLTLGVPDVTHPDDIGASLVAVGRLIADGVPVSIDKRYRRPDGSVIWANSSVSRLDPVGPGAPCTLLAVTVDLTERTLARQALADSEARARLLAERLNLAIAGSGDGLWDWDLIDDEISLSPRMQAIMDWPATAHGHALQQWRQRIHPEDLPHTLAALRDALDGVTPACHAEYRVRGPHGSWRWVLARAIVVARDGAQRPLHMTGLVTDISAERRSQESIWLHANFDPLTGLPNRRLFRARLDRAVKAACRAGTLLALLFIDLDHFKETNDLLGHDGGDTLLRQAADRITGCVRAADTVARLGGDEFTAILSQLEHPHAAGVTARKINHALAQPFTLGSEQIHLSASIGITLYPADANAPERLIRNADQAMYVAKSGGRNQFSYFTPAMQRQAQHRLRLIADLRGAVANGELEVYYQPVTELRSGTIVKAEALLRWQHPTLGLLTPGSFIPYAEESGLISEIGDWVFHQAADCAARWGRLQVSVNRSPVEFMARSAGSDWPSYLGRLGLPGTCMAVEITEAVLLNASARVCAQLRQYHDAGMQVAIDDFGTGYSSLAYLKKFDIDYLKIDQAFIREMVHNDGDRAIVRSVTAMAHELGLQVIAEGIENPLQRDLLLAAGCDYGQGYHFSAPLPVPAFERLLRGQRP